MLMILAKNGVELGYTQRELIDLGLGTAKGELRQTEIAEWIDRHKK